MTIQLLTEFFMWCTVINGGLLIFWTVMLMSAPSLVYSIQTKFFPMPRETFNVVIYAFIGLFKLFFIVFNVVPYFAFILIG